MCSIERKLIEVTTLSKGRTLLFGIHSEMLGFDIADKKFDQGIGYLLRLASMIPTGLTVSIREEITKYIPRLAHRLIEV